MSKSPNPYLSSEFLPANADAARQSLRDPYSQPTSPDMVARLDALILGALKPIEDKVDVFQMHFREGRPIPSHVVSQFRDDLEDAFARAIAVIEVAAPNGADRSAAIRLVRIIFWSMCSAREDWSAEQRKAVAEVQEQQMFLLHWTLLASLSARVG